MSGDQPATTGSIPIVPLRLLGEVALFRYVTVEHAATYRAVVQVFFEAKQHYVIELRPEDVLDRIRSAGYHSEAETAEQLEYHLTRLVEWGNLLRTHDTASVARIEDFYRKRYLFHLSAVGEAAHRAVLEVEATLGKSGSLQATMLVKIREALRALAAASVPALDPGQLFVALHDLYSAFDTLTEEANRFIGELNRHLGADRLEEDRFLMHKRAVLAYVGRFVEQLRLLAPEIAGGVEAIERAGMDRIIAAAATAADLPPALGDGDPVATWIRERRDKWLGIRSWFAAGQPGSKPTLERLAEVAVEAVVGLVRTLGRLNDKRTRPVDRPADFRTLARWFACCETDDQAHELAQAAFGLHRARHFHIGDADLETTSPSTSWWDATPIEVPVRLRSHGGVSHAGRPATAPDHTLGKEWIAERRRQERLRVEGALRRFVGRERMKLGDIAAVDEAAFDLLLVLLDQALGAARLPDGVREARTSDGRFVVTLHPPAPGDSAWVKVVTPRGQLRCRNYALTVMETGRAAGGSRAGSSPVIPQVATSHGGRGGGG